VPHVAHLPHVVQCHDLLALRSALGDIPENPTSGTGRLYQRYIRCGFRRARHFISISQKSRDDLHRFGGVEAHTSEVVYNGFNHPYRALSPQDALAVLRKAGLPADERRCLLHVGGGQWYKNSAGVLRLYGCHAEVEHQAGRRPRPLWMLSPPPDAALARVLESLPPQAEVRFFQGLDAQVVEALYGHAEVLLFPSLDEGFGWPIVEALACGCPVITTGEAPMTEAGGDVAHYLPRLRSADPMDAWARSGAALLGDVLARSPSQREAASARAQAWASRFAADAAIGRYLSIYERVLAAERPAAHTKVYA
jgi:glycosyltransferase involved in cell wall biosynthesis